MKTHRFAIGHDVPGDDGPRARAALVKVDGVPPEDAALAEVLDAHSICHLGHGCVEDDEVAAHLVLDGRGKSR